MRKIFGVLAVLLMLVLVSEAEAVEFKPLLGLTVERAFKALAIAGEESGFLIDYESAEIGCQAVCVAKEEIGKGTHLMVSFDEKTKAVREISLFVQVAYEGRDAVMDAVIRAGYSLKMLLMMANPDITEDQLKSMQNRVGILSEEIQRGETRNVVVRKAKISGALMQGLYMVSMGAAE